MATKLKWWLVFRPAYVALAIAASAIFIGGTLFSLFEKDANIIDGWYWATVVMPTVGFGDYSPHTTLGRSVYQYVWASGIVSQLLLLGAFTSWLNAQRAKFASRASDTATMDDDLDGAIVKVEAFCEDMSGTLAALKELDNDPEVRAALERAHAKRRQ